jgi:hypothetical protein
MATMKTANRTNAAPAKPAGPTIQLTKAKDALAAAAKLRGARDQWWQELQKWDGKPLAAFIAHAKENPPTKPKTGKYAATGEPPMGWVNWFKRQEYLTLKD